MLEKSDACLGWWWQEEEERPARGLPCCCYAPAFDGEVSTPTMRHASRDPTPWSMVRRKTYFYRTPATMLFHLASYATPRLVGGGYSHKGGLHCDGAGSSAAAAAPPHEKTSEKKYTLLLFGGSREALREEGKQRERSRVEEHRHAIPKSRMVFDAPHRV